MGHRTEQSEASPTTLLQLSEPPHWLIRPYYAISKSVSKHEVKTRVTQGLRMIREGLRHRAKSRQFHAAKREVQCCHRLTVLL
jgi:hypothetical protein